MRKPTVITVTLSLFLLAAGLADTPNAWAFTEKKVSKTLPPMPKPAYTVGYKWHYIKDGKKEGVWVVTATGNGTVSWRDSDDCNWITLDRGFAPARKWDNCKDDSTGTQRVRFMGGNIWPLRVGNKFSYSVKGRYTRGGKSWSGVRQCKVKKQVRIETVSGEVDTYKVVCDDPWSTRTWWLSPELKAVVRYKRERRNYTKPDHTWEMTKIEWPQVAAKPQEVISAMKTATVPPAEASYQQGYRYSTGQGMPKDYAKALEWYRKAAAQGHARAQYNLGGAYANGRGVEVSKYTAADWFFKAGQSFLREGKREKALQAADAIERVVPGHLLVKRLLEQVYGQPATPATVTRQPPPTKQTVTPAPTLAKRMPTATLGGADSSFAQPDEQATRTTPYRIAIFPFAGVFSQATEGQTADSLQARIQREPAWALAYSDYDSALNEPRIKNPKRLWGGSAVRKKPNLDVLYTIGRERDLDGIVMVWGGGGGGNWAARGTERMPITLYLIDTDRRQVYRRKGTVGTVKKMTNPVFADFMRGRPQVVQVKATATPATVTKQAVTPTVAKLNKPIKTIALLEIPDPRRYRLDGGAGATTFFFGGLVGALTAQLKHPKYGKFSFSAVAQCSLTKHLQARGYTVIRIAVDRKKPHQLLGDYTPLSAAGADVYLDVAPGDVGFSRKGLGFAKKVGPQVAVIARLVSASSKDILTEEWFQYGWSGKAYMGGTELDAPKDHTFRNAKAVKANMPRAIEQLVRGIDVVARAIAAELSLWTGDVDEVKVGSAQKAMTKQVFADCY